MTGHSRGFAGLLIVLALIPVFAACNTSPSEPAPEPTSATSTSVVTATSLALAPTRTPVTETTPAASPTTVVQPLDTPQPSDLTVAADGYLNGLVKERAFSGVVLLARDDKVVHLKGYGMADAAKSVLNTPDTTFQIASMTGAFTAMSIMMLQEQGKLNVQDRACKYVEGCPAAWQAITIRQLLTHTSGVPDVDPSAAANLPFALDSLTFEQALGLIKDRPLDFEPGTHYSYSNAGYVALGKIIEQASGEKYADFVTRHILWPLGMHDSGFDRGDPGVRGRAVGYSAGKAANFDIFPLMYAAGGLYSTAADIYKWDQALYTEKLVSKATLDAIFTPGLSDYGYGWVITSGPHGKVTSHTGNVPGFLSQINRYVGSHRRSSCLATAKRQICRLSCPSWRGCSFDRQSAFHVLP